MRRRRTWSRAVAAAAPFVAAAALGTLARAQEPGAVVPHGQDRPPNPPRSPAEAARAMTLPPGFRAEVVAAEPDLVNPVAMTFDERGRIWVTESLEYPRRSAGPGRDRVKVIEDTDGDGKADRFTVFAEGLNIPSGIAVGHGGVWVANSPDILFLRDTDGDGRADSREVVATGFGRSDTHELPNSLTWGPDGWLYGWNGVFNPSRVRSKNGRTYEFTCAIFRIHPKTRIFEVWCEGTSNPWGIAIDPEGSFFASACVIDHLWHLVETGYYIRQGGPYPPFTLPIGSIVDHTHQKAAYCGAHYFDSPAYPEEYRGRIYMGNIHGNAINVDVLERNRATYQATPAPDFLTANDAWFMPVSQKTGPDGCLYILDWYDQYHCYQDANRDPAGIDRLKGRLYRIRYEEAPRRSGFDLARSPDDELMKLLGSPNVYDREIAQRLLTERATPALRGRLAALVLDGKADRKARMHGLWALIGSGPLNPGFHAKLLEDDDPTFRAWGVRAAGNMGGVSSAIRRRLAEMARDPSPDVRLQVVIAARKVWGEDRLPILLETLSYSANDPLIPMIVWPSLHPILADHQAEIIEWLDRSAGRENGFERLAPSAFDRLLGSPRAEARFLARLLDASLRMEEGLEALDRLSERFARGDVPAPLKASLSRELGDLLRQTVQLHQFPARQAAGCLIALSYCGDARGLQFASSMARTGSPPGNRARSEEVRIRAFRAVLYRNPDEILRRIAPGILREDDSASSSDFRGDVLEALGRLDDPRVASVILESFPRLDPGLKLMAVEVLSGRPAWTKALLSAIVEKKVPASSVNVNQVREWQGGEDAEIAARVRSIWGTVREDRDPGREHIVGEMKAMIRRTPGDPMAGKSVFEKLCAQCHRIHGAGQDVGPDLTSNGRNDFDQLVSNVFDPSLVIGPGYQATTIATDDGRILTGLLAETGADRVVLRTQGGRRETIPRDRIEQMKTGQVSLMPEGIEKQLTPREIADLFAYLSLDRPPTDPRAKPLPGAGPIEHRTK